MACHPARRTGPSDPPLFPPSPSTTGFRLDETETVVAAGRAAGPSGGECTTCTGDPDLPGRGFRTTVRGTVSELGDGAAGTVGGTPLLTGVEIGGEECEVETVPPGCPATAASPPDGGGGADACGFCPGGITADAGRELPMVSDGKTYTCGELEVLAGDVVGGTVECGALLFAEPYCCPDSR